MKRLQFSVTINATAQTIWQILWEDKNYRQWTSVFGPGSYAVSNWKSGEKIQFLSEGSGMFSRIEQMIPNQYMAFQHLGVVENGVEMPATPETKAWEGAMETYLITEKEGHTTLDVVLDTTEGHADYFSDAFPKALAEVKRMAESY